MYNWIKVVPIGDRERSDEIRRDLRVENMTLKARQAMFHWYGHILQMDEGNKVKQMMKMEVRGTRGKGRPRMMLGQHQA